MTICYTDTWSSFWERITVMVCPRRDHFFRFTSYTECNCISYLPHSSWKKLILLVIISIIPLLYTLQKRSFCHEQSKPFSATWAVAKSTTYFLNVLRLEFRLDISCWGWHPKIHQGWSRNKQWQTNDENINNWNTLHCFL